MNKQFHGIDVNALLKIKGKKDFPVNPDMLFQAASISKPMFAMTVLRYVDKALIDLDADIPGVVSDFVKRPVSFSALIRI